MSNYDGKGVEIWTSITGNCRITSANWFEYVTGTAKYNKGIRLAECKMYSEGAKEYLGLQQSDPEDEEDEGSVDCVQFGEDIVVW